MIDALFSGGTYQGVKHMLDMTSDRQEALAGNIANVETPGYKRIDLDRSAVSDFQSQLSAAAHSGNFSAVSSPGAMPTTTKLVADTDAHSQRADGNNVEVDQELLSMSQNTVEYNALTEFASNSLKCLKMAITGNSAA